MKVLSKLQGLIVAIFAGWASADDGTREFVFHHEYILGTSLELRLSVESRKVAADAEQAALAEIERLERVLSRYDGGSELMRWQAGGIDAQKAVSSELANVLERAEYWRVRTAGAFDVSVSDSVPREKNRAPYSLTTANGKHLALRKEESPISLDGLAKGYIIDCVCEAIQKHAPGIRNYSVNIGGDIRAMGNRPLPVFIANPFDPAQGSQPIEKIVVSHSLAVATSGSYHRGSHIIDPRTGAPPRRLIASATVIAPNAMDADALATSLCVLSAENGVSLVNTLDSVECLIILNNGEKITSRRWPGMVASEKYHLVSGKDSRDNAKSGLLVNFTLNRPKGGQYRRPYVAVWLEDEEGFPVKTAVLWMQTESPGPRWHRDLTRWYRNDRTRKLVEESALIGTISEATRGPGKYSARFDGTDNTGSRLPDGNYTLCLEVAREHGTYQIIRKSIELSEKPIPKKELEGNIEMTGVSYQYTPPGKEGLH